MWGQCLRLNPGLIQQQTMPVAPKGILVTRNVSGCVCVRSVCLESLCRETCLVWAWHTSSAMLLQDFYEDVFEELAAFGEVENVNVCDNLADHMASTMMTGWGARLSYT